MDRKITGVKITKWIFLLIKSSYANTVIVYRKTKMEKSQKFKLQ